MAGRDPSRCCCVDCKFSDFPEKGSVDDETGVCRKYAARPLTANQELFDEYYEGALWLRIDLEDFCWEWEEGPEGKGQEWDG